MHKEHDSVLADNLDCDQYTRCKAREQALNAAILRADISAGFEQYFEIFETFYAEDIEVSSEPQEQPFQGKARVRFPSRRLSDPTSHHGGNRWPVGICPRESHSGRSQ